MLQLGVSHHIDANPMLTYMAIFRVESNAIHSIEHPNGVDCSPSTAIQIRWMDMGHFLKWMAIQWTNGRQKYIKLYVNY